MAINVSESDSDSELSLLGSALADAVEEEEEEEILILNAAELERLNLVEWALVTGRRIDIINDNKHAQLLRIQRWVNWIQSGNYILVLRETPNALRRAPSFVEKQDFDKSAEESPILQMITARAKKYAATSKIAALELIVLIAAALRAYEQVNYTGPPLKENITDIFTDLSTTSNSFLEFAGEIASPLCVLSEALLLARAASMAVCCQLEDNCTTAQWWSARAACYHWRALIATKSCGAARAKLWQQCHDWMDQVCAFSFKDQDIAAMACLERGLIAHHFDQESRGKSHFFKAAQLAHLEIELTASLGKRTKFQRKSLPQLKLETNLSTVESQAKPQVIPLDKDSVLLEDGIHFDDAQHNNPDQTPDQTPDQIALRQAIVLALCLDVKNSNPEKEGLTAQEMRAYVDAACASAQNWMVFSTAILIKCRLEASSAYSADRAALQLEVLVSQHSTMCTKEQDARLNKDDAPVQERIKFLSVLDYPAIWEAKSELAYAMMNLGALVSAAEQFAQISQWDDVVECYAAAGRRSEALKVLESQDKNPNLLCVLAEIQDESQDFETAWQDSRYRCARAARGLGRFHARAKNWQLAAEWFAKALAVAPHAPATWFDTGIAHMRLALVNEDPEHSWREAARCFSRAASQEPDDADSWANLAAVLIQVRDLKPAASALDAAIRLRPDDWRLWENATRVHVALKRPARAIQALNRLLDLRTRSKRSVDSYLEQFEIVCRQVEQLEAETVDLPPSEAAKFNATTAASALDAYILRLKREAPASPGTSFARLWALCAIRVSLKMNNSNQVKNEALLRDFKAKQLRALLGTFNDDSASSKDTAQLCRVALEFSRVHDHATPSDRSSAALLLRSIADRAKLPADHDLRVQASCLEKFLL